MLAYIPFTFTYNVEVVVDEINGDVLHAYDLSKY